VWASRYWVKRTHCPFSASEDETVGHLRELGAGIRQAHGAHPILLTTSDWLAVFIERNTDMLREEFLVPQPETPVIRRLLSKWDMHLLAHEHGIPTPVTEHIVSPEDVDRFLENVTFPIVMKAADRYAPNPPPTKLLGSRQELMEEVAGHDPAQSGLNMVLQEHIPGDADTVWMCNGYFGADVAGAVIFTGKKLRQVSAAGIACLAECVPNETVAAQTARLMQGVGYRGCVGIGYRYDRRDGLYKLLDVNARVSSVFRLFAGTNGIDVVRACYLDLTGQEVPATTPPPGRKWMLETDVVVAARDIVDGRLSMAEWLRSIRGVRELHWFARDDPQPFLVRLGEWCHNAATLVLRRRHRTSLRPRLPMSSHQALRRSITRIRGDLRETAPRGGRPLL
jgi:predicted ATP-grasp superfamily ATP-dependent carboligase